MAPKKDKVTKADLEGKLRALQGGTNEKIAEKKASAIQIGAGVGVLLLILVFLLGQRRGNRQTTTVEIRRF
jgi:hypothetical protein